MDNARWRHKRNLERLVDLNPDLKVLADRKWLDQCQNRFVCYMAKKMWLFELTDDELHQVNKATSGYLMVTSQTGEATPIEPGTRQIRGKITSMKQKGEQWFANVRTFEGNNVIYTPITPLTMAKQDPKTLIGRSISFDADITVSKRDNTFGFAHDVKLLGFIKEEASVK